MPLFKRRNAVKAKQAKNTPIESPQKEEQSIISDVNSMLNELVTAVSEHIDSELKNVEDMNLFPANEILKQTDGTQESDKCSSLVSTNSISQQKDSSRESKCSSSISKNNIAELKDSVHQENDECTDTVKTDEVSNRTECSQENDPIMLKNSSKQRDFEKKEDCSAQITDVSNKTSSQKDGKSEKLVTTNDISNQNDSSQVNAKEISTLLTSDVLREMDSAQGNNDFVKPVSTNNVTNVLKQETNESNVKKIESSENDLSENISTHEKNIAMKKIRSSSESGSSIESQTKYVRRKFGSEAEVLSICKKILPPEQQKGINEAVVKYIDNLIKASIFQAVKNINVDNLCEELITDVSNRKNSESTESEEDFMVEQRLSSNSISELVELQNDGNTTNKDEEGSLLPGFEGKISKRESFENETGDHASFGGYLADLEDTASVDDLKSIEEDSLCNSSCSGLENVFQFRNSNSEGSEQEATGKSVDCEINETMTTAIVQTVRDETKEQENTPPQETTDAVTKNVQELSTDSACVGENEKPIVFDENDDHPSPISLGESLSNEQEQVNLPNENPSKSLQETDKNFPMLQHIDIKNLKIISAENSEASLTSLDEETFLMEDDFKVEENKSTSQDKGDSFQSQTTSEEERMKINWKVGNLQVKLPHKSRGKTSLKAWKKRRVVIQPDEFVNDPTNQSLVISVYGSKKHETTFWHSVSSQKAVVFRSNSHTHRYAYTISEGGQAIIHLSSDSETETQEWMAAIRAVLWPPSPFMELEKLLSGQEFEVSIIDNEFSYHAGLLGMYGYLSITPKKLILLHPQQGYVIQEWYLNTVDKFQFVLQPKAQDMHKVLCMTTCKDSSTGQGELIFYCKEAVTLLQALASNIHQVLSYHSKQEGGRYQKELEELAEWMVAPPQDCLNVEDDEHYKVPPRQVKSLLDIPNFIFNKSISPVASAIYPAPKSEIMETLDATKTKLTNTSKDSGISTCTSNDDFLNCSTASFVLGGGPMTGKSSDSELSDSYSPPRTPEITKKKIMSEVVKEEEALATEK